MDYLQLIDAHKQWDQLPRAKCYNDYMNERNNTEWQTGKVSIAEIEKLFHFIRSWEQHFRGDTETFQKIYQGNYLRIRFFLNKTIEDVDLSDPELRMRITNLFDVVANCTKERTRRYESTDTSLILQTILPELFVSWNDPIKKSAKVYSRGANYSGAFLPAMQNEVNEAILTCQNDRKLGRQEAIAYIRDRCDNRSFAKLADEYNYLYPPKKIDLFKLNLPNRINPHPISTKTAIKPIAPAEKKVDDKQPSFPVTLGQEYVGRISSLSQTDGVVLVNGFRCQVPKARLGELVKFRIHTINGDFAEAQLIRVLQSKNADM